MVFIGQWFDWLDNIHSNDSIIWTWKNGFAWSRGWLIEQQQQQQFNSLKFFLKTIQR